LTESTSKLQRREQPLWFEKQRKRRDAIFLETTRSLCSTCLAVIDAKILMRNSQIILRKWCRDHGFEEVLIHSDADWYLRAAKYNRPGDLPLRFSTKVKDGCPFDCGLCPEHEQHLCLGLIDITNACNIQCPTCYADSRGTDYLTLAQVQKALDTYFTIEGQGGVIQYSGGEPTIHPQFIEILKLGIQAPLDSLMVNTNGIAFADNPDLVKQIKDISDDKLEIYLQFDGFSDEVYQKLRGAKLYRKKMQALENLLKYEIPVNFASTIKRNVNEDQIGALVDFGVHTSGIRGIHFQPAAYVGRFGSLDPLNRVTNTEIIHAIEDQTEGMFRMNDFLPLPCSHPSQIALTYAYIQGKKVKPIPRFIDIEPYLDQFTNTIYADPRPIYKRAVEGLWSAGTSFNSLKTLYDFSCVCGLPVKKEFFSSNGRAKIANENAFRIILIQFQDKYNWDMKVARKSCIGFIQPDGKAIPFDTYNLLYRNGG